MAIYQAMQIQILIQFTMNEYHLPLKNQDKLYRIVFID